MSPPPGPFGVRLSPHDTGLDTTGAHPTPATQPLTYNALLTASHQSLAGLQARFCALAARKDDLRAQLATFWAREAALGTPVLSFDGPPGTGGSSSSSSSSSSSFFTAFSSSSPPSSGSSDSSFCSCDHRSDVTDSVFGSGSYVSALTSSPQSASFFLRDSLSSSSLSSSSSSSSSFSSHPSTSSSPRLTASALQKVSAHILARHTAAIRDLHQDWCTLRHICSTERSAATSLFEDLMTTIERVLLAGPAVLAHKIDVWDHLFECCVRSESSSGSADGTPGHGSLRDKLWLLRKRYTTDLGTGSLANAWHRLPFLNQPVTDLVTGPEAGHVRLRLFEDVTTWLMRRTREARQRSRALNLSFSGIVGDVDAPLLDARTRVEKYTNAAAAAAADGAAGAPAPPLPWKTKVMAENLRRVLEWACASRAGSPPSSQSSAGAGSPPVPKSVIVGYVDRLCRGEMEGLLTVQELCELVPVLESVCLGVSGQSTISSSQSSASSTPAWLADSAVEQHLATAVGLAQWTEYARKLLYSDLATLQQRILDLVLELGDVAAEIAETEPLVPHPGM